MMRLGYNKVYRMPVGYMGWLQAAAPVEKTEAESNLLGEGDLFPECGLISVNRSADEVYLESITRSGAFALSELTVDYLFVELFNERCLGCIEEVTNYQVLFRAFSESARLTQRVRIIGIGAGSERNGIINFKSSHQIPFPLFADEHWEIFECLGSPALPTSYLLKREKDGRRRIVLMQSGHIEDTNRLLDRITYLLL